MNHITSKTVLGILGSGQLARMTAIAASDIGIQTYVYCSESETSPAEHVATKTVKGSFHNLETILNFCQDCDIITLENEFIDQKVLEAIDQKFPNKLYPNSKTFSMIGDKISEKEFFEQAGIKVVPFKKVEFKKDILSFCETYGYPVVLKSARGGYDGYGNITIRSSLEIDDAIKKLSGNLLVEAFIAYEKELAILVARNANADIVFYPVAHTIQENHICHFVSAPARISDALHEKIKDQAKKAMIAINAVGIFAFEFFLTGDGDLYLNESAPRPHNSGHYTIEGCMTSQFHNHVRSVFNLPLGKTDLNAPAVVMLNLLGTQNSVAELKPINDFLHDVQGHLHLYGKINSKIGRKMGHYTLLGEDQNEMLATLKQLQKKYTL